MDRKFFFKVKISHKYKLFKLTRLPFGTLGGQNSPVTPVNQKITLLKLANNYGLLQGWPRHGLWAILALEDFVNDLSRCFNMFFLLVMIAISYKRGNNVETLDHDDCFRC